MANNTAGISTLGVRLGWAVGASHTAPSSYTWLERCNSIGGISLDTEQIDASALEDEISRYIAGRQDTGGSWEVTFNITDEVVTQLEAMINAYKGKETTEGLFFEVWSPYMTKAFYVKVQAPLHLPMSEMNQNELQTIALTFIVEDYLGMDTAKKPE